MVDFRVILDCDRIDRMIGSHRKIVLLALQRVLKIHAGGWAVKFQGFLKSPQLNSIYLNKLSMAVKTRFCFFQIFRFSALENQRNI